MNGIIIGSSLAVVIAGISSLSGCTSNHSDTPRALEREIVREDFENCRPAEAILQDLDQAGYWNLRKKDWQTKLLTAASTNTPDLIYDPQLKGCFDIYAETRATEHEVAFGLRLTSDKEITVIKAPNEGASSNKHWNVKVLFKKNAVMDGQKIIIKNLGKKIYLDSLIFTRCDYPYLKSELDRLSKDVDRVHRDTLPAFMTNRFEAIMRSRSALASELEDIKGKPMETSDAARNKLRENTEKLEKEARSLKTLFQLYSQNGDSHKKGYFAGAAGNLAKIPRDLDLFSAKTAGTAKLSAAKGEKEGFQIILLSFTNELKNVKIEASDLSAGKNKIAKENIKIYRVGYVRTQEPAYKTKYIGWWPDPLLPLEEKNREIYRINTEEIQPVWVTIKVPGDAAAGKYAGMVMIKPSNADETKIGINLHVRNFALPAHNHITSFATIRSDNPYVKAFYNVSFPDRTYFKIASFLLDYRLGPGVQYLTPGLVDINRRPLDFTLLDEVTPELIEKGMNEVFIGEAFATYNERNYEALSDICKHLENKGWLDKAHIWTIDECKADKYDLFKKTAKAMKDTCPSLKRAHSVCGPFPAPIAGYEEIWAVNLKDWDNDQEIYEQEQASGKKIWWAVNLAGPPPYPCAAIDAPAISHRLLFWMAWKYRLDGVLFWAADAWWGIKPLPVTNALPWTETSWSTMSSTEPGVNGDSYLYYPGPSGAQLPSIRLENIRDSIEDYEYLYLLESSTRELEKEGKHKRLIDDSRKILTSASSLITTPESYCKDPNKLSDTRDRIGGQIEKNLNVINRK